ncbi:hypothetical protein LDG_8018 [Legionella drancourtii LLAP12]|uniref:Uncharacterized protein n=1 Tax=Legionella drancourtii LLAP12 TaxID=658187 RepID=G9ERV0_9GAMM|nr:hypothetical protein LDG_8018 [Legionella drancourtii LLAP12]
MPPAKMVICLPKPLLLLFWDTKLFSIKKAYSPYAARV